MGAIGTIFLSVVASLLVAEGMDWLPWLTIFVIRMAARRLPEDVRSRYQEQWSADAEAIPGKLARLVWAIDLIRASYKMASKPESSEEQRSSAPRSRKNALSANDLVAAAPNLGSPALGQEQVKCNHCGMALDEPPSIPPSQRLPCPHCGSTSRSFSVSITERVVMGASFEARTTKCR
jgi:hypothetical protein